METIEEVMERMMERCGASGAAIIRIDDGEIVYLQNLSKLPINVVSIACQAAVEMFRGKLMNDMLNTVKRFRRGTEGPTILESIRFTFSNAFHWVTVVKERYLLVLVAPKAGMSPGYVETLFRSFLPRIAVLLE